MARGAAAAALVVATILGFVIHRHRSLAFASAAKNFDAQSFERLTEWVKLHGGRFHEALALAEPAPCGASRGIVAMESVPLCSNPSFLPRTLADNPSPLPVANNPNPIIPNPDPNPKVHKTDVSKEPLIVVPESLQMDGLRALAALEPLVPDDVLKKAPMRTLDDGALITLYLAHERAKGADSFYSLYVASLPMQAPCAWAMSDGDLLAAISTYGAILDTRGWMGQVLEARRYVERVSGGLAEDYGDHLGVTQEDLTWALGIVSSRSMGGSEAPTLVPLLDLLNHHANAHPFTGHNGMDDAIRERAEFMAFGEDGGVRSEGETVLQYLNERGSESNPDWAWWSYTHDGEQPRALGVGDECFANYITEDYTPFDWFLNLGFVPVDALPVTFEAPAGEL